MNATAWVGIAGIAGTLAGIVLGHLLQRRRESDLAKRRHEEWLRGERLRVYSALIDALHRHVTSVQGLLETKNPDTATAVIEDRYGAASAIHQDLERHASEAYLIGGESMVH